MREDVAQEIAQELCSAIEWYAGRPVGLLDPDKILYLLDALGHEHNEDCHNQAGWKGWRREERS